MGSDQSIIRGLRKKPYLLYLLTFSGLFILTAFIVFLPFFLEKKSFIWVPDGYDQHYTSLIYYSSYMRGILKEFLNSGRWSFPLWDFKIGQGSDIITTLSYYCIGDPLTLFSIFFSQSHIEAFYNFLVVFRIYLSGLSFSVYCFYFRKDKLSVLLGAFVYMFSGYTLVAIKHPFFINPMIYLPLLFVGIEIVLRKGRPYFFIFMIFISAISNFYFFFMLTILSVLYAVLSFFLISELKKDARNFLKVLIKGCLSYMLGIAMAAVLLLPIIEVMTKSYRYSDSGSKLFLLYDWKYYVKLLLDFTAKAQEKAWVCLGFAATTIVAVPTLFMLKHEKLKPLKLAFIAAVFFLAIPAAGYMFNGFGYVSNRWVFALVFIVALIFVNVFPHISEALDERVLIGAFLWLDVAFAADILLMLKSHHRDIVYIFPLLLTLQSLYFANRFRDRLKPGILKYTFFLLTVLSICVNGLLIYDKHSMNFVKQYLTKGTYLKAVKNSPLEQISKIKTSDFYRVDTYSLEDNKVKQKRGVSINEAMLLGYNGLSTYFSIINPNYSKFISELNIMGATTTFKISNLDNRTALDELASVKYFMQPRKDKISEPYDFKKLRTFYDHKDPVDLYENKYSLPLGYTYDSYINMRSFEKLDTLDKQQAMLESVVLDDGDASVKVKKGSYSSEKISIPIQKTDKSNIKPEYKYLHNKKIYSLKTLPDSEVYVVIKGISFGNKENFNVIAETCKTRRSVEFLDKAENYYFGRKDAVINLGYNKDSLSSLMIYTDKKGKLSYDNISVYCLPMKGYYDKVKKLKENALTDVKIDTNKITGDISLKKDKLLCLSVPYSKGWKAEIDGNEAPVYKANIMYMLIPVNKGKHIVELRYSTPGLVEGARVSAVSIIVFMFLNLFNILSVKKKHA